MRLCLYSLLIMSYGSCWNNLQLDICVYLTNLNSLPYTTTGLSLRSSHCLYFFVLCIIAMCYVPVLIENELTIFFD